MNITRLNIIDFKREGKITKLFLALSLLFVLGIVFPVGLFAQSGQVYNPELLDSSTDAPIMLYLQGSETGSTIVKPGCSEDVRIKSVNKKAIRIVNVNIVRLIEGMDENNQVLTYTKKEYNLSEEGVAKLNEKFRRTKSNILFSEMEKAIDLKDCSRKKSGNSVATRDSVFTRFRRVKLYTITVEDSEGRQNKLQIYMVSFQDALVSK